MAAFLEILESTKTDTIPNNIAIKFTGKNLINPQRIAMNMG